MSCVERLALMLLCVCSLKWKACPHACVWGGYYGSAGGLVRQAGHSALPGVKLSP